MNILWSVVFSDYVELILTIMRPHNFHLLQSVIKNYFSIIAKKNYLSSYIPVTDTFTLNSSANCAISATLYNNQSHKNAKWLLKVH